jgi:low molecular weight phosphotyrosine protein phosphatase
MDSQNLRDIKFAQRKRPDGKAKVMLFGVYSGGLEEEVEDPYYGGQDGFQTAYDQAVKFSKNFLDNLRSVKEETGEVS